MEGGKSFRLWRMWEELRLLWLVEEEFIRPLSGAVFQLNGQLGLNRHSLKAERN